MIIIAPLALGSLKTQETFKLTVLTSASLVASNQIYQLNKFRHHQISQHTYIHVSNSFHMLKLNWTIKINYLVH